jgi:hemolysin III
VAAAALPLLPQRAGWPATLLIVGGGALYTLGAVVYARQRPNPWPRVFGYHEIFHALVIAAAAMHYVAIAVFVVPEAA